MIMGCSFCVTINITLSYLCMSQPFKSDSLRRLEQLNQEEEETSKLFQLSNFYQDSRLNVQKLKAQISQFKTKRNHDRFRPQSISYGEANHSTNNRQLNPNQALPGTSKGDISFNSTINKHKQHKQPHRFDKTNLNSKKIAKLQVNIPKLVNRNQARTSMENSRNQPHDRKTQYNRHHLSTPSDYDASNSHQEPVLKVVELNTRQDLLEYENYVRELWALYELLTRVMMNVQKHFEEEELGMLKYTENVCSERYEFINVFMMKQLHPKFHRLIVTSRLLENLSIVYLALQTCKRKRSSEPHLTNFIGYCTSNIIFLIRLFTLGYLVPQQQLSSEIKDIIESIRHFEYDSFMQEMKDPKEILRRMEHNNETISILQVKLYSTKQKEFQNSVTRFLKSSIPQDSAKDNIKPLFEYAHFIYEFLSYYLHKDKNIGILPSLEIAPTPYLTLPYPKTVVIDPFDTLICQKSTKIMIRSFAELFLEKLGHRCNVVYWTDKMPAEADKFLDLLPGAEEPRSNFFRLYRYHCKETTVNDSDVLLKILWRLGSKVENMIIIDSAETKFQFNQENGIKFPWKGEKRDKRLLALLDLLEPLLTKDTNLMSSLAHIRPQIENINKLKYLQRKIMANKMKKIKNVGSMLAQEEEEEPHSHMAFHRSKPQHYQHHQNPSERYPSHLQPNEHIYINKQHQQEEEHETVPLGREWDKNHAQGNGQAIQKTKQEVTLPGVQQYESQPEEELEDLMDSHSDEN